MSIRSAFSIAALFAFLAWPVLALAQGDIVIQPPDDLARDVYRGITSKDYFLAAGGALSLLTIGVRWLLAKKWPRFESEIWGVALVAVLAGCGALGNAWLADERLASTTTLLGAVKVWAAAVFAYVTSRKLFSAATKPNLVLVRSSEEA